MNKIFIILLFSFFGFLRTSYAQNIVKASALLGNIGLQYERALGKRFSLSAQGGYLTPGSLEIGSVEIKPTLGYHFEGRFYFSGKKDLLEGWHVGPFYKRFGVKLTDTAENTKGEASISSLGLAMGYQWVLNSNITIGITFGAGTLKIEGKGDITKDDEGNSIIDDLNDELPVSVFPHLGFSLGYNF